MAITLKMCTTYMIILNFISAKSLVGLPLLLIYDAKIHIVLQKGHDLIDSGNPNLYLEINESFPYKSKEAYSRAWFYVFEYAVCPKCYES
jgi:hypothetical protein